MGVPHVPWRALGWPGPGRTQQSTAQQHRWGDGQGCIRRKGTSEPQRRSGRRLEEVAKAVEGGYCRLQMPLSLARDSGWAEAGALEAGGGGGGGAGQGGVGNSKVGLVRSGPGTRSMHPTPPGTLWPLVQTTLCRRCFRQLPNHGLYNTQHVGCLLYIGPLFAFGGWWERVLGVFTKSERRSAPPPPAAPPQY